jgi:hypothetical protein
MHQLMAHPQRQLRVFIDDGPRAGETLSVDPGPNGRPPREIVLDDARPHSGETEEHKRTSTYRLDGADLEYGLYVYRLGRR